MAEETGKFTSDSAILAMTSKINSTDISSISTNGKATNVAIVNDALKGTSKAIFQKGLTITYNYDLLYSWQYSKRFGTNKEYLTGVTFVISNIALSHVYYRDLQIRPYITGRDGASFVEKIPEDSLVIQSMTTSPSGNTSGTFSQNFYGTTFIFEAGINIYSSSGELLAKVPLANRNSSRQETPIVICNTPVPHCTCHSGASNCNCPNSIDCGNASCDNISCGQTPCSNTSCSNTSCTFQSTISCPSGNVPACPSHTICVDQPQCNAPKPVCNLCGAQGCSYKGCTCQGNTNEDVLKCPSGHHFTTDDGEEKVTGYEHSCGNWVPSPEKEEEDKKHAEEVKCGKKPYAGTCKGDGSPHSGLTELCGNEDFCYTEKATQDAIDGKYCYPSNDPTKPCSACNPPQCSPQEPHCSTHTPEPPSCIGDNNNECGQSADY